MEGLIVPGTLPWPLGNYTSPGLGAQNSWEKEIHRQMVTDAVWGEPRTEIGKKPL